MASLSRFAASRAGSSSPCIVTRSRIRPPPSLPRHQCYRGVVNHLQLFGSTSAVCDSPHAIPSPTVYPLFEKATSTWQYLVADPATSLTVVIDPVLNYDPAAGRISTKTADRLLAFIKDKDLKVTRLLETHAHADHLTSSQYLKSQLWSEGLDVPVCIGTRIKDVQRTFAPVYGFDASSLDNTFDVYFEDEEEFDVGNLKCRVIHLPGHTPDHVGYVIGNSIFTGDSIFLPDVGSARVDFPGGDAKALYASIRRLLAFPEDYRLYVGHDYPDGRPQEAMTTVLESKARNRHAGLGVSEDEFIRFRDARDVGLGSPRLLHPSLQVNIRAGKLPPRDESGRVFLRIPVLGDEALDVRAA